MLYTLSQKNTSIEKYIKHGFLWKGHGSIETFHVMDHVAPLPKSEYLELIQEPFFFFWNFGQVCNPTDVPKLSPARDCQTCNQRALDGTV